MARTSRINKLTQELFEDPLISDAQAVKDITKRQREIAEKRRAFALAREKRREEELAKLPKEMTAREGALMPNSIKHLPQDMLINVPLDNNRIKTVAFDNSIHLGNAFYALSVFLLVRTRERGRVLSLLEDLDKLFEKEVIKPIKKQQSYALKQFKDYAIGVNNDIIKRTSEPIKFEFISRTPRSSKWLTWCQQADVAANLLLKLTHLGLVSERDYFSRVNEMANALDNYARIVFRTRTTAFTLVQKEVKKDSQAKESYEQIQQELKSTKGESLGENGELVVEKESEKTPEPEPEK